MYWFLKPVFVLSVGIIMTRRNFRSTQRLYGNIRERIIWALELNHKCGVTNWTIRASRHHLDWFPQLKLNIIALKKKDSFVEAIFTVARLISVNISSFMNVHETSLYQGRYKSFLDLETQHKQQHHQYW